MWQERAGKLICFGVGAVGVWLLLRYALGGLMPFLIAALLACLLSPLARRMAEVCRLPRKLCGFFVVLLALFLTGGLMSVLLSRFLREAESLLAGWGTSVRVHDLWQELLSMLPSRVRQLLSDRVTELLFERAVSDVTGVLATAVGKLLSATPTALFHLLVTVLATFYLTVDTEALLEQLGKLLPKGRGEEMGRLRLRVKGVAGRYLRAVLLLFLLTFLEAFVGLALLGRRYALLCALGVATVDILPVFGSGTVLIPWALWSFVRGESAVGLGLLILYGVITLIRQIAEPHLIGESSGIHPLLSLVGMVMGLRLFGVVGMLLAPFGLSFLGIFSRKEEKEKIGRSKKST